MNMKSECLTESEILAYVDGLIDPRGREKVEAHLARCPSCLRAVAEIKHLADAHVTEPVTAPPAALSRAAELIRERLAAAPRLSIVAAVQEGLVRILRTTGSLLPPPRLEPVAVRGQKRPAPVPRAYKSLSGCMVTVEVSPGEAGVRVDIALADEKSSECPEGVKVKLRAGEAVETRYSRGGRVTFTEVRKGVSVLEVEGVGKILLEIE
jgi:anti-sigma factor RsiW